MPKYTYTRLWRVNHKLIVADTIENAILLYNTWSQDASSQEYDITRVQAIGDSQIPENFDIIIKDN